MPSKKSTTATDKPSSKKSKADSDKPESKTKVKAKANPVPKDYATFAADAGSHLTVAIGDAKGKQYLAMTVKPHEFKTGTFGWTETKHSTIPLQDSKDDAKVDVIINMNITVKKSKSTAPKKDDKEKGKASSSKAKANGSKANGSKANGKKRKAEDEDEEEEEAEENGENEEEGDKAEENGEDEEEDDSSPESESDD